MASSCWRKMIFILVVMFIHFSWNYIHWLHFVIHWWKAFCLFFCSQALVKLFGCPCNYNWTMTSSMLTGERRYNMIIFSVQHPLWSPIFLVVKILAVQKTGISKLYLVIWLNIFFFLIGKNRIILEKGTKRKAQSIQGVYKGPLKHTQEKGKQSRPSSSA